MWVKKHKPWFLWPYAISTLCLKMVMISPTLNRFLIKFQRKKVRKAISAELTEFHQFQIISFFRNHLLSNLLTEIEMCFFAFLLHYRKGIESHMWAHVHRTYFGWKEKDEIILREKECNSIVTCWFSPKSHCTSKQHFLFNKDKRAASSDWHEVDINQT